MNRLLIAGVACLVGSVTGAGVFEQASSVDPKDRAALETVRAAFLALPDDLQYAEARRLIPLLKDEQRHALVTGLLLVVGCNGVPEVADAVDYDHDPHVWCLQIRDKAPRGARSLFVKALERTKNGAQLQYIAEGLERTGGVTPDMAANLKRFADDEYGRDAARRLLAKIGPEASGAVPGRKKASDEADAIRLKTLDEILAPLPADAKHHSPCPLLKDLHVKGANNEEFHVTVHFSDRVIAPEWPITIAVWGKTDKGYRRLDLLTVDRYDSGPGYFLPIKAFRYGGQLFVHVTWMWDGTGAFRQDWLYALGPNFAVERVEIEPPGEAYAPQLHKDERVAKGEEYSFSEKGLNFEFYVWNKGDCNATPTAGMVKGRFKLTDKLFSGRHVRLVAESYKRESVPHER